MTPLFAVLFAAIVLFSVSTLLFATRLAAATSFRRIARPRGFIEGRTPKATEAIWVLSYGLLVVQAVSLWAFPSVGSEWVTDVRLLTLFFCFFVFLYAHTVQLPLLCLWFSKTGVWMARGAGGLIPYTDIRGASVTNHRKLPLGEEAAFAKLVFVAEGRKCLFRARRFLCFLPVSDLRALSDRLPTEGKEAHAALHTPLLLRVTRTLSRCSALLILLGTLCLLFSSALFSPYRAEREPAVNQTELQTIAPISEVVAADGKLFVRYASIEALNVYTEDGRFLWSLSLARPAAHGVSEQDGISVSGGVLRYCSAGVCRYFATADGTELNGADCAELPFAAPTDAHFINSDTRVIYRFDDLNVWRQAANGDFIVVLSRPPLLQLFSPTAAWTLCLIGLLTLFVWRQLDDRVELLLRREEEAARAEAVSDAIPNA